MGFLFAPSHHSALRHVAQARRELGFHSVFNLLGPLTNPAGARYQLLGTFAGERVEQTARVLGRLGSRRAWVVHGHDGLDEIVALRAHGRGGAARGRHGAHASP